MTRRFPLLLAAAALGAATVGQPAAAQAFSLRQGYSPDSTQVVTEARIAIGDLDAASPAGAQALLARIGAAANTVCGADDAMTESQKAKFRDCRRMAMSGAVARMRSPALSAMAREARDPSR